MSNYLPRYFSWSAITGFLTLCNVRAAAQRLEERVRGFINQPNPEAPTRIREEEPEALDPVHWCLWT